MKKVFAIFAAVCFVAASFVACKNAPEQDVFEEIVYTIDEIEEIEECSENVTR